MDMGKKPLSRVWWWRPILSTICAKITLSTGLVVSQFLEANATQLTYHGLQLLMDSIPRGKLSVLFRNNHASISVYH